MSMEQSCVPNFGMPVLIDPEIICSNDNQLVSATGKG